MKITCTLVQYSRVKPGKGEWMFHNRGFHEKGYSGKQLSEFVDTNIKNGYESVLKLEIWSVNNKGKLLEVIKSVDVDFSKEKTTIYFHNIVYVYHHLDDNIYCASLIHKI